ncbi:uncharacterized protein MKZ38_007690 [Zalerion maritima]|uniref:Uncharacterized protein n=1 Tax=Zalerion maritima TaxID=339359 RepID=A0AAD5RM88_9PEZI|nr:uncharacterized protein MKZ38_007690 [Zalerion maritima]
MGCRVNLQFQNHVSTPDESLDDIDMRIPPQFMPTPPATANTPLGSHRRNETRKGDTAVQNASLAAQVDPKRLGSIQRPDTYSAQSSMQISISDSPPSGSPCPTSNPTYQGTKPTLSEMMPWWTQNKKSQKPLPTPPSFTRGVTPFHPFRKKITRTRDACNHSTLTRIWANHLPCDRCGQTPDWGWMLRCTEDVELQLRDAHQDGQFPPIDDNITRAFADSIKPTKNGPQARSEFSGLMSGFSDQERAQYTACELERILDQRMNVLQLAKEDSKALYGSDDFWNPQKPWVRPDDRNCKYRLCARCASHKECRTFESLNAVANGDLSMTSVMGFSFWSIGHRPVLDAKVASRLGTRPVPSSDNHLDRAGDPPSKNASLNVTPLSVTGSTIFPTVTSEHGCARTGTNDPIQDVASTDSESGRDRFPAIDKIYDDKYPFRSPWSPPVTPRPSFAKMATDIGGRSDSSLKTSQETKSRLISSMKVSPGDTPTPASLIPFYDPDAELRNDVGLSLPFNAHEHGKAVTTPLPAEDPNEKFYLEETPMMKAERLSGVFHKEPLEVCGGFAFTEESVEEGIVDVVAPSRNGSACSSEQEEQGRVKDLDIRSDKDT